MFAKRKPIKKLFESDYCGYYFPNAFHIVMDKDNPYLEKNDDDIISRNDDNFNIFIHEYWHYLHNMTTFAHLKNFHIFMKLLTLFSKTMHPHCDGESNGNDSLNKTEIKEVISITEMYNLYDGDDLPSNISEDKIIDDFEIIDVVINNINFKYNNKDVPVSKITLKIEININGKLSTHELDLGIRSIEESIANEIDSFFKSNSNETTYPASYIIYLVLRKLSLYYLKYELTKYELCALGTLSLNTPDPSKYLIDFFIRLKNSLDKSTPFEEAINNFKNEIIEFLKHAKESISISLNSLCKSYENRGVLETTVNYLVEKQISYIDLRISNPIFDLKPFAENKIDSNELNSLFESIIPCDIIQECYSADYDDIESDFMGSFADAISKWNDNDEPPIGFGVLHCHLVFMLSHLTEDGFDSTKIIKSEKQQNDESRCPYYRLCPMEQRKNNSNVCKNSGWEYYDKSNKNQCWYATGVGAFIGIFR